MKIREDINNDLELEKWFSYTFNLIQDPLLRAKITFDVLKDHKKIDSAELRSKSIFFFGQAKKNDYILLHPSVSRI